MSDILHIVFNSFWSFIGSLMICSVLFNGTASIISAIRGNNVPFEPLIKFDVKK